jgi:hypothetical protein
MSFQAVEKFKNVYVLLRICSLYNFSMVDKATVTLTNLGHVTGRNSKKKFLTVTVDVTH